VYEALPAGGQAPPVAESGRRFRLASPRTAVVLGVLTLVPARADEAEHLDSIGHVLLADSSATAGALSSHRVALGRGADGAMPHRHDRFDTHFLDSPAWQRARSAA
jgi:hypothetical protein